MRIFTIITLAGLVAMLSLWLGRFTAWGRLKGALGAVLALVTAGVLILCAVLPGNSFYGPTLAKVDTGGRKLVALTFDDGPYGEATVELLQLLQREQVKVTFFLVGENAARYPELVRREAEQGHEIALHANVHQDLLKLEEQALTANITQGKLTVEQLSGQKLQYMRPPHGFRDWLVQEKIQAAGLRVVNWSVIPRDWTNPGTEVITERVCAGVEPGAIVLLHDGDSPAGSASRQQTIAATAQIIQRLRAEGYTFVTISELLAAAK